MPLGCSKPGAALSQRCANCRLNSAQPALPPNWAASHMASGSSSTYGQDLQLKLHVTATEGRTFAGMPALGAVGAFFLHFAFRILPPAFCLPFPPPPSLEPLSLFLLCHQFMYNSFPPALEPLYILVCAWPCIPPGLGRFHRLYRWNPLISIHNRQLAHVTGRQAGKC